MTPKKCSGHRWNSALKTPPRLSTTMTQWIEDLLIVPGHALLKDEAKPNQPLDYYLDESKWHLQEFQKGEIEFYINHIQAGLIALAKNPHALLIFSGGRTRPGNKKWSEASSYLSIARSLPEWNEDLEQRIATEDYARDSIENLCFGMFLFDQLMGRFPDNTTILNWGFKEDRFDFHRKTLGVPKKRFSYKGVNNPNKASLEAALKGEEKTLRQFQKDPFGLSEILLNKKHLRDPYRDGNPYLKFLSDFPFKTNRENLRRLLEEG